MNEDVLKKKLTAAMAEPPPPAKLVEDTVARVKMIQAGRAAEKRLKEEAGSLPASERAALASDGVLGWLAGKGILPLGSDAGKMKAQLLEDPHFRKLSEKDPLRVMSGLQDGTLLKDTFRGGEAQRETPPKMKRGPVL